MEWLRFHFNWVKKLQGDSFLFRSFPIHVRMAVLALTYKLSTFSFTALAVAEMKYFLDRTRHVLIVVTWWPPRSEKCKVSGSQWYSRHYMNLSFKVSSHNLLKLIYNMSSWYRFDSLTFLPWFTKPTLAQQPLDGLTKGMRRAECPANVYTDLVPAFAACTSTQDRLLAFRSLLQLFVICHNIW